MKAYILYAHSTEGYPLVMSVFSSYSAMLVWLDQIHNYKSEIDSAGYFKEQLNIDEMEFNIYRDWETDRKSTRLNSSHSGESRMPSSA